MMTQCGSRSWNKNNTLPMLINGSDETVGYFSTVSVLLEHCCWMPVSDVTVMCFHTAARVSNTPRTTSSNISAKITDPGFGFEIAPANRYAVSLLLLAAAETVAYSLFVCFYTPLAVTSAGLSFQCEFCCNCGFSVELHRVHTRALVWTRF